MANEHDHDHILHDHNDDGIDRRGFLKCMAWAGTGVVWTITAGGLPTSQVFGATKGAKATKAAKGGLKFVQISDSHMGFNKPANPDVGGTLKAAIDKINALPDAPEFMLHTGDLTHGNRAEEFDTMDQILKSAKTKEIFFVPGEHDVSVDDGKLYLERYGKGSKGNGWYSFDHKGVHFLGLNNVAQIEGMGKLGTDQLKWIKDDLSKLGTSTPVVLFAHIPLWSVYPQWGWGTKDSEEAMGYLKRFGSVTVLNGHIHQVMQKVEGNVAFHTAMSTAFPQPAPGTAPAAGPMKVPAEKLRSVLGVVDVHYIAQNHSLAVVDSPLEGADLPKAGAGLWTPDSEREELFG
ncbi:MAG TPA: metallophosphoesterase [Candidatus Angelobacter sp.]|nr:metallophosphoesterase [Candidatus Angelobacter sp.]